MLTRYYKAVNYQKELDEEMIASPRKLKANRRRESGSDTDFAAAGESDADDDSELDEAIDSREFEPQQRRSAQGMRAKSIAKSHHTPQKIAASRAKQSGRSKKSTPKTKATLAATQKVAVSKKTPQKQVASGKRQQGPAKNPAGPAKTRATPAKVTGSTENAPESSGKRVQVSSMSTNSKNGEENTKSALISSEMKQSSKKLSNSGDEWQSAADKSSNQASNVKTKVDPVASGGIYVMDAAETGEAQGVIAGLSKSPKTFHDSLNANISPIATQSRANELSSQTSTGSPQCEGLSPQMLSTSDHSTLTNSTVLKLSSEIPPEPIFQPVIPSSSHAANPGTNPGASNNSSSLSPTTRISQ